MSNLVPATIALPTFNRPQQPPANTNNTGQPQQTQSQQRQQQQPQQYEHQQIPGQQPFDEQMNLDPQGPRRPDAPAQQQNQPYLDDQDMIPEENIDLSALLYANSLLPDVPQPEPQFPTTEGFMPNHHILPPEPEYIAPSQPLPEAGSSPGQTRLRKCNNCRNTRAHCSGHEPCNHCVVANITCAYTYGPSRASPPKRRHSPDDAGETGGPRKRTRLPPAPQRRALVPPIFRRRPFLGVPKDGLCDHCRSGGHQDKPCDADHAAEIECSQCTKYRNLVDPNHLCTVRGGEYWQKRFANSRPTYPSFDLDTSCCIRCKEKRNSSRPTLCDIDDRVKIGCTPCNVDGVLCKVYNEEKALGISLAPDGSADFMWDRPAQGDGTIARERRPWWRHMCRECHSQLGQRRWHACSWILDVRLGEYKCSRCVENGLPCVDPWTGVQYDTPYQYSGSGNKIFTANKSGPRTGRQRCTNCSINNMHCRGYNNEDAGFSCTKCSVWGLTCQLPSDNGLPQTLPHMDRKMIGYSRVSTDKATTFVGCKPCRDNGDNCDRNRPCDSCHSKGRKCENWTTGTCRRWVTVGADTPDYYMSLGYGPNGVDSNRWDVPEKQLIGPNKPKRAEMSVACLPVLGERDTLSGSVEVSQAAPRAFGPGVGEKYDKFFNGLSLNFSRIGGTKTGDSLSYESPTSQVYYGDNNAAHEALENGQKYEKWVGAFNAQHGGPAQKYKIFPPFEGQPQNRDEIQHVVGNNRGTSNADLQCMAQEAELLVDPALAMDMDNDAGQRNPIDIDVHEQNRIAREIRQAMHLYARDMRFIPVEVRQFSIPEVFDVPATAKPVQAPQRVLLQLEDNPQAQPRSPYQTFWDPPVYEKHLRELLSKWKKPAHNVLCDIPDEPANFDGPAEHEARCEENCPPCGELVRNGAYCENLQHMVRPQPYTVCEECDMRGKKNLFQGPMPLTRGEFLNMRAYACDACVMTEEGTATFGGTWSGTPSNPVTGCLCAAKLLNRRLCQHHRYRLAATMMVQSMFVAEWAVTNFGPDKCLFCKEQPSKLVVDGNFSTSLVYLCLNCQGVVCENFERDLQPGVHDWLGGVEPVTLWRQNWEPMSIV
ncbi:hypothetical protein CI238_07290 [Colletotrichum incanum]|uniref:Zn(2)-C6 fungal-type domain-containing protein n=1 Tax=Colletotrichum incanum TaxID=1573173 RepID=A0A167ADC7_COLIC|nr:hypothetical protein CI238_07290 [Colletotrichum incanum]